MKEPIPTSNRESRFLAASVEIRAADKDDQPSKVFGYAAKFNTPSERMGKRGTEFVEVIAPGAFDDVLQDDVRALFNHDESAILARSKNGKGTLALGVDDVGLWYEFEAPDTQAGRDLRTSISRGDIDQSSFSFEVGQDNVKETRSEDGNRLFERTISKIKRLFDVSPVTSPAYPDATVALRSLEEFRKPEPTGDGVQSPSQEELAEVGDWACRFGV